MLRRIENETATALFQVTFANAAAAVLGVFFVPAPTLRRLCACSELCGLPLSPDVQTHKPVMSLKRAAPLYL